MALAKWTGFLFFSYTNWLEPSAHAECADYKSDQNFQRWPKSTRSNLMQRKITIAISAATLVPNLPIWKPTCAFIAERNRLLVHSAIKRAGLKSTLEESLIVANSANIPPQGHIFSKGTCKLLQGKNPFIAPIVTSQRGVTSKSTCQHIQKRGVSVVTSATIHASKLMISRNTCCSILKCRITM